MQLQILRFQREGKKKFVFRQNVAALFKRELGPQQQKKHILQEGDLKKKHCFEF